MDGIQLLHSPGCCAHCRCEDDGGEDWAIFDITMAPGSRGPRAKALTQTVLPAYSVCPRCLASPWGIALQEILTSPFAQTVTEYQRCTILCTHTPTRRRRGIIAHMTGRSPVMTCPSCWNPADVEHLDAEPGPGRLARWLLRVLPDFGRQPARPTQ